MSAEMPAKPMLAPQADAVREEARWQSVVRRDPQADGEFVYAVRTTGVYCRPSCPSRAAKRQNVEFFDTGGLAAAAGYRPCKRCRPDLPSQQQRRIELVAEACQAIEQATAFAEAAAEPDPESIMDGVYA